MLLYRPLWHADKKQDRNALAKPLLSILQEVEGNPVVKSGVSQVFMWQQICLTAGCEKGMTHLTSLQGQWWCWDKKPLLQMSLPICAASAAPDWLIDATPHMKVTFKQTLPACLMMLISA